MYHAVVQAVGSAVNRTSAGGKKLSLRSNFTTRKSDFDGNV